MAAGARTSAAAPLSRRSGAAADATMHRGARLLAGFRRRVTLRPARGLLYSTAAMVVTLRHAQSSFEPSTGKRRWSRVLGLVYVLWNCFAGQLHPWKRKKLVYIDILASLSFCIRTFRQFDGSRAIRQAVSFCTRNARFATHLWLPGLTLVLHLWQFPPQQ